MIGVVDEALSGTTGSGAEPSAIGFSYLASRSGRAPLAIRTSHADTSGVRAMQPRQGGQGQILVFLRAAPAILWGIGCDGPPPPETTGSILRPTQAKIDRDWSAANARRGELLCKRVDADLSEAEERELASLNWQAERRIAPIARRSLAMLLALPAPPTAADSPPESTG